MIAKHEWKLNDPHHDAANICCISFNAHFGQPFNISLREVETDTLCYPKLLTHEVQDIVYAAGYNLTAKKQWYRHPSELCNFTGNKFYQWWMRNMPHYGTVITVTRASDKEYWQRKLGDKAPYYIKN